MPALGPLLVGHDDCALLAKIKVRRSGGGYAAPTHPAAPAAATPRAHDMLHMPLAQVNGRGERLSGSRDVFLTRTLSLAYFFGLLGVAGKERMHIVHRVLSQANDGLSPCWRSTVVVCGSGMRLKSLPYSCALIACIQCAWLSTVCVPAVHLFASLLHSAS